MCKQISRNNNIPNLKYRIHVGDKVFCVTQQMTNRMMRLLCSYRIYLLANQNTGNVSKGLFVSSRNGGLLVPAECYFLALHPIITLRGVRPPEASFRVALDSICFKAS